MYVMVTDYGFSAESKKHYITYKVTDIDKETQNKFICRLSEDTEIKNDELYITAYFEEAYFPFKSDEAKHKPEDFISREEIEMTAYLTSILEE